MRYKPFWTGDRVITITEYDGVPSGTVGKIHTKWAGTVYVIRLKNGQFRWLDSTEFSSIDPNNPYELKVGDIGVVTSDEHRHHYAKVGDLFEVVKVAHDVDYYEVSVGSDIKRFAGFQLANYH